MVNLEDIVSWTPDDYAAEIRQNNAAIRDLLNDNEQLLSSYMSNVMMTSEETAKYLRCDPGNIPYVIPSLRVGRGRLYRLSDVEKFIRDNMRVRKAKS